EGGVTGVAVGTALLGVDSRVENTGDLTVEARSAGVAIAAGLVSAPVGLDTDEGRNALINEGSVTVTARGVDGSDSFFAAAAGMFGVGSESELTNAEDARLHVDAVGM